MKKKLLITGTSGFIGWNLAQHASASWQVSGFYHQHPIHIGGVQSYAVDIADLSQLEKAFDGIEPDAVIHLAAVSSPNFCEQHRQSAWQVNVAASQKLAELCYAVQIPCVFASSSQVYDGDHASYTEQSPVNPLNAYGMQKVEAEKLMRDAYPSVTVCRIPLSFGLAPPTASSFLQPMLEAFATDMPQNLFYDEFRCMLGARSAVQGFMLALQHPGELFLMAGDESISRYDFGLKVARIFGYGEQLIKRCSQADIKMAARRPADLTLDNSKMKTRGFAPYSIDEELIYIRDQLAA